MKRIFSAYRQSVRQAWPYYLALILATMAFFSLWALRAPNLEKIRGQIEKSHAAEKPARTQQYMQVALPKAGIFGAGVSLIFLLAGPWVLRASPLPEPSPEPPVDRRQRLLWVTAALAVAWSATMNAPRLTQSFWGDEEATMRRCVVGEYLQDENGTLEWTPCSWVDALYYYRDPNNHPFFSILAKTSHSVLPPKPDPEDFYFSELALRLPAYLAGLLGILLMARLAVLLRAPEAGICAVIWMVLHPYFIRYGVDARGYSLLFAVVPAMLIFLTQSLRHGLWKYWLGWGICQFLVIWAYPGALYTLVAGNLAALLGLWKMHPEASLALKLGQAKRWLIGNAVGATLSVLALLPCVAPMMLYLKRERISGEIDAGWFADAFSHLFTGRAWKPWADHALVTSWLPFWNTQSALVILLLALLALVVVLGSLKLWQLGREQRILLIGLLGPIPLLILGAKAGGNILYAWYFLIGFPGIALLIGAGIWQAGLLLAKLVRQPWASPLGAAALLTGFAVITWKPGTILRNNSVEANRESVMQMRPIRNAAHGDLSGVMTISFVFWTRGYDPACVIVKNVAELQAALKQSEDRKIPAYVHFGHLAFARKTHPEILQFLETSGQFDPLPTYHGQDVQCSRYLYRYKNPSLTATAPK
jgi:hypothetical protein